MGDMMTMRDAASKVGIDRATVARWLATDRLKRSQTVMVRNLQATLVDVSEVSALAAGITVGRGHKKTRRRSK